MMKRAFQVQVLATLVLAFACVAVHAAEDGFVSIFDGKTLKGWEAMPAKAAPAWSVKDGMIVGDGDKARGYLAFEKKDIADLELKLSYRFPGKGNSGISIRTREDKTGRRHFQSYHADLGHVGIGKWVLGAWDFHTPGRRAPGQEGSHRRGTYFPKKELLALSGIRCTGPRKRNPKPLTGGVSPNRLDSDRH